MAKVAISQVRGGPEGLTSLDEIVEAALALVARDGLEALTMRRLADELGRAVMTLYTYVATKNDLLEKMAERTLGSLGDPPPKGDWRRRVTGLMTELHDRLLARPAIASITLVRERQLTALDPFREAVLDALHDAGLNDRETVDAFTALTAYVLGYVTIQRARSGIRVETEKRRLAALSRDRFPRLVASAESYAAHVSAGAFDLGLHSMLRGLTAQLKGSTRTLQRRRTRR